MAGVLSRAAGRLCSSTRTAFSITTVTRPAAFPSVPRASLLPRLVHTDAIPSPLLPPWTREEVRLMAKEAMGEHVQEIRAACWERYESLYAKYLKQSDLATTRHAEVMTKLIEIQESVTQMYFRACIAMVGVAAVMQYKAEITDMLMKIVDGGDRPTQQDFASTLQEELDIAKANLREEFPGMVKAAVAQYLQQHEEEEESHEG